ncbi:hypothetical protein LY78DRAFT_95204 [Colletotrichum sublineola]|nr:hypothetical protein LY78DRAFT_95204 [Colletotrichum sublineola]
MKLRSRCMHTDWERDCISMRKYAIDIDMIEEKVPPLSDPARELEILLTGLEIGALRSLDWALGTCVPQSLLGPTGCLSLNQRNIESIRLVTDGSCEWNEQRGHRLALVAFPHLKRLSWTGLSTQADLESLGDVLDQKSHQLEELEIDLAYYRHLSDRLGFSYDVEDYDDVFAAGILRGSSRTKRKFPLLKRLALTAVSFTPGKTNASAQQSLRRIYDAFDFTSLQSLKLRHCEGWQDLLSLLNTGAEPLKLRSLELQWSLNNSFEAYETLSGFLQKFQGLEELFLSTTGRGNSPEIWRAALHHRGSLRRFVHHQRTIEFADDEQDDENNYEQDDECECDLPDPSGGGHGSADFLRGLDLMSLGLCCSPRFMRIFVSGFASTTSLRILHMRQSGPDLERYPSWAQSASEDDLPFDFAGIDLPVSSKFPTLGKSFVEFAQWVFGPSGIRSLRLLAYGDFSYDGRFERATLLLCRRDASCNTGDSGTKDANRRLYFREVVKGEDAELWGLYEREKHVIVACPCDTLFHG